MQHVPLYRQVYDQLRQRMASGVYARGSALPSEVRLSREFSVSQITVRRALHELALDGLLERRQGIGNIVRENARSVLIGLSSFTADVAAGRLRLVRTMLTDEMIPCPAEVAAKLNLQTGALVRHLSRLDMEGDVAISVDDVYTPAALAAGITHEMAASPLFLSLWQVASGMVAYSADYEMAAERPTKHMQTLLQISHDIPLLVSSEVNRDEAGRPLHYIVSRYRGDRVRLSGAMQIRTLP
jgi:GntR family transcriptional regulator